MQTVTLVRTRVGDSFTYKMGKLTITVDQYTKAYRSAKKIVMKGVKGSIVKGVPKNVVVVEAHDIPDHLVVS